MSSSPSSRILGLGISVPEKVITNHDLEKLVDTSDEWIVTRTGIRERRVLADGEVISDFAAQACERAIQDAGITKDDVDMLLVSTYTGDCLCPSMSCVVHSKLGLASAPALDMNAACTGFIYSLQTADALIRSGMYRNILVVGAEGQSRFVDWQHRDTCVIFGDGAGAVVVGQNLNGGSRRILGSVLGTDSSGVPFITIESSGSALPPTPEVLQERRQYLRMNGREVFKFAVRAMGQALDEGLKRAGLTAEDIDLLVPHQANTRIIEAAASRLSLPGEKVIVNIAKYGNTASASIPLALEDARREGRLKEGMTLALVGFGAGFTYGCVVLKW